MAGEVRMNDVRVTKPSQTVAPGVKVEIITRPPFVSRGGEKLAGAMAAFSIDVSRAVCADIGASTGGFTDCLLQHGAERIYAIDVGHGILDWRLRNDKRVVVMERTNARYLQTLLEPIDFVCIDASFISLKLLLPRAADWLRPQGELVALIKPQFEAGKGLVGRGGVVRDPQVHKIVLEHVMEFLRENGFGVLGLIKSSLKGPKGNIEFLVWARKDAAWVDQTEPIAQLLGEIYAELSDTPQGPASDG